MTVDKIIDSLLDTRWLAMDCGGKYHLIRYREDLFNPSRKFLKISKACKKGKVTSVTLMLEGDYYKAHSVDVDDFCPKCLKKLLTRKYNISFSDYRLNSGSIWLHRQEFDLHE
jgi:hypothetical protein